MRDIIEAKVGRLAEKIVSSKNNPKNGLGGHESGSTGYTPEKFWV